MRTRRHDTEDAEVYIDMTPMLDFVLNMLIFFIVTTTFVKASGVEVSIPNAASAKNSEASNVFVAIKADGSVWLDQREVDVFALRPMIARLRAENPDAAVVVQSDSAASTGQLVAVMDQIRLGGIEKIAVAANTPAP